MILQTLTLRQKKLLLAFSLCLLCWFAFLVPVTSAESVTPPEQTQTMYTITEQELTTLEINLAKLSAINSKLQMESKTQNKQLTQLQEQLRLLQSQLTALRQESEKQQALLTAANKSLEEYATEAKRERLRIKAQRNFWECFAAAAAIVAVTK
ncbi:MAG: hypothetical protein SPL86_03705 [Succiniclasticum sp.]|uniref:hypothetical protein n=1 Tax=Succiniclasticum sp. TaxID=2775030 RepID=UPI002A917588|nr:hypothetical protein [Succiniclasticum sp.]MDY6290569.1 hypothetical protein [Succiniclasticum sp.]